MKKSPMDNLFFELYGYYPKKAGTAFELIAAAALKVITGDSLKYDQHLVGQFSKTDFQIDVLNVDKSQIIEVKDHTISMKKVGRKEIQNFQGALVDLDVKSGLFVSGTDYTKPAKMYSKNSTINPNVKQIDLYTLREASICDEEGRLNRISFEATEIVIDYKLGVMKFFWTKKARKKFLNIGRNNIPIVEIDFLHNQDGTVYCQLADLIIENRNSLIGAQGEFGLGCWVMHNKFVKINDELFELNGVTFKVPYLKNKRKFTVERDGEAKVLIKSEDGCVNRLLTDKQFKNILFQNGEVERE